LRSIDIPNSVISIGDRAFAGCQYLRSIDIPNSVVSIGENAFHYCLFLENLTIGKSVERIGKGAFSKCRLESIIVASENPYYDSRENCNALIETSTSTLLFGCRNTVIPDSIICIADEAFYDCSIESVDIPNSVIRIGNGAFQGCSYLKDLTLGSNISYIGDHAFRGCHTLYDMIMPNSVTYIGEKAFGGCFKMKNLSIPRSVAHIGDGAFQYCDSLKSVYCYIDDLSSISMGDEVFYIYKTALSDGRTLYVPYGTLEAYQADTRWSKYFGTIVEMDPEPGMNGDVNGDGKLSIGDVTSLIYQLLSGDELPAYCDVNGDGKVSIGDVTELINMLLSTD
jgi:hypothetical protein